MIFRQVENWERGVGFSRRTESGWDPSGVGSGQGGRPVLRLDGPKPHPAFRLRGEFATGGKFHVGKPNLIAWIKSQTNCSRSVPIKSLGLAMLNHSLGASSHPSGS